MKFSDTDIDNAERLADRLAAYVHRDEFSQAHDLVTSAYYNFLDAIRSRGRPDQAIISGHVPAPYRPEEEALFDWHRAALGTIFPSRVADHYADHIAGYAKCDEFGLHGPGHQGILAVGNRLEYAPSHALGNQLAHNAPGDLVADAVGFDWLGAADRHTVADLLMDGYDRFHNSYVRQRTEVGIAGTAEPILQRTRKYFSGKETLRQKALLHGHGNHLFVGDTLWRELKQLTHPVDAANYTAAIWKRSAAAYDGIFGSNEITFPWTVLPRPVMPAPYPEAGSHTEAIALGRRHASTFER